jgi:hypothetical protein
MTLDIPAKADKRISLCIAGEPVAHSSFVRRNSNTWQMHGTIMVVATQHSLNSGTSQCPGSCQHLTAVL